VAVTLSRAESVEAARAKARDAAAALHITLDEDANGG
jgi:formate-dependent phosphoribosylglycinamide formyltransferase (GAR transformylase)